MGKQDNHGGRRGPRPTLMITVGFAYFSAARHPGSEAELVSPGLSRSEVGGPHQHPRWMAGVPGLRVVEDVAASAGAGTTTVRGIRSWAAGGAARRPSTVAWLAL